MSASLLSTGVPVKPIKDAFGKAFRKLEAKPSSKPYWVLWASSAITIIFSLSDKIGCSNSPKLSSVLCFNLNFSMVVKITPPAPALNKSRKSVVDSACCTSPTRSFANTKFSYSCWSKSLRSTCTTMVGFFSSGRLRKIPV